MKDNKTIVEDAGEWRGVYKLAGAAAIIIVVFIPVQAAVFAIWPPPFDSVEGWFALFQKNKLIGLVDMDLLLAIDYILTLVIYIALWAALRQANFALATVALVFEIASTCIYFASCGAFEMLHLSNGYAAAITTAGRNIFLA